MTPFRKRISPFLTTIFLACLTSGVMAQTPAGTPPPAGNMEMTTTDAKPISPVEKRVFLDNPLANLAAKADVEYHFKRTGTLGDNFDDTVVLHVRDGGVEKGRLASADFLTGKNVIEFPEVDHAEGNPVLLYFLERDVREMERITKGKRNFFQKRVRLALADADTFKPVKIQFGGRDITGHEVALQPYLSDPVMASKAPKYMNKTYYITLSDQVPGGVYQIRTSVADSTANASAPLISETLTFAKLRK